MNDKIKIAIVDDHALFRKSLHVLIDLFPRYQVIFDAANGKDFIDQLAPHNLPHIVLMDINMPVMDGYTTTLWLKENYPTINVIALSTMDAETAIIKMIKSGAKGYVLKDADPEELKLAFDEVLSRGYFYNDLVTRKVMNSIRQLTETDSEINLFVKLSQREVDFLRFTCTELTYKEIADKMNVSVRTIEGYRDLLCEKLNLKSRIGLAVYAIKNNLHQNIS
ncbi:response regulator transcription factor [Pedobacter sp. Du54]|uniref:response regulator transcription factor n=1 Tax=Pedobacter anseongensis TaxID=3133439 RepID=UPI00309A87E3